GFAPALLWSIAARHDLPRRTRAALAALFGLGLIVPIAITAWWFGAHGALDAFVHFTVGVNGRLNADRFSPFPRLVSNVIHAPALYGLGAAGLFASVRTIRR